MRGARETAAEGRWQVSEDGRLRRRDGERVQGTKRVCECRGEGGGRAERVRCYDTVLAKR